MKAILLVLPKMLSVLWEAVANRFMLKWLLTKLVKRSDTLLDDNCLELIYHLKDDEPELAMAKIKLIFEELERIIDKKKVKSKV